MESITDGTNNTVAVSECVVGETFGITDTAGIAEMKTYGKNKNAEQTFDVGKAVKVLMPE